MAKWLPLFVAAAALVASACGGAPEKSPSPVTPAPPGEPYAKLSEWHLFKNFEDQVPNTGVVPYEVNAPLYSDYANKHRFIYLPKGAQVGYQPDADWQFPVGTILVKTFGFLYDMRDPSQGERLIETRLLVHESDGWSAHTYLYNDAETEAQNTIVGADIEVSWIDQNGQKQKNLYGVPTTAQCQECHGSNQNLNTLGGRTRQLNRTHDYGQGLINQIDYMNQLGWFKSPPPPASKRETLANPFGTAPLVDRARAYLDANCGHCHREGGGATQSALRLAYEYTDPSDNPTNWGVCKVPTSAGGATCGNTVDVLPGDPNHSVLICRISSTDPKVRMPPLGTRMVDAQGVALLRRWIRNMTQPGCQ
jgi:uncharacterized repeat protein (TIGR03806 family)